MFLNYKKPYTVLNKLFKAWYEGSSKFFIEKGLKRGNIDTKLFIKEKGKENLLAQVYVDDMIFGSTDPILC